MYQLWYTLRVDKNNEEPILGVVFYKTEAGNEPVREWLKSMPREDIKTAQYAWPLGMPLIRKMERGLWEVRSSISQGIARVIFTIKDSMMILLHGFVKKSQKTPPNELDTARRRLNNLEKD
jgi:phage-related protein